MVKMPANRIASEGPFKWQFGAVIGTFWQMAASRVGPLEAAKMPANQDFKMVAWDGIEPPNRFSGDFFPVKVALQT